MEIQQIQTKIYEVRGQKVMLDYDLASLYEVETRALNQAVKRNIDRFPERFMFRLTQEEWENMLSQFVMTYPAKRPKSAPPLAFTEHGITMLASVFINLKTTEGMIDLLNIYRINNRLLKNENSRLQDEIISLKEQLAYYSKQPTNFNSSKIHDSLPKLTLVKGL